MNLHNNPQESPSEATTVTVMQQTTDGRVTIHTGEDTSENRVVIIVQDGVGNFDRQYVVPYEDGRVIMEGLARQSTGFYVGYLVDRGKGKLAPPYW
jgi:hypothetical protein